MASCIIFKKDLDKFGKKLMKEVYNFLHDDYFLTYDEVKSAKKYWDKNLVKKFIDFHKKDKFHFDCLYINFLSHKDLYKMSHEDLLKKIEDQIKNENIDLDIIFYILYNLKLYPEIDEDLYYNHRAFISCFNAYHYYHSYLSD